MHTHSKTMKTRQQRSATYMQKQAKCMQKCTFARHSTSHTYFLPVLSTTLAQKQSVKANKRTERRLQGEVVDNGQQTAFTQGIGKETQVLVGTNNPGENSSMKCSVLIMQPSSNHAVRSAVQLTCRPGSKQMCPQPRACARPPDSRATTSPRPPPKTTHTWMY